MKVTDALAAHRDQTVVTARRGPLAGRRLWVETPPGALEHDAFRVRVVDEDGDRYRVQFSNLVAGEEEVVRVSASRAQDEATEAAAFRSLERAMNGRRLRGLVRRHRGNVEVRLSAVEAFALARALDARPGSV